MANMNLVTGYAGTAHVTAADDGYFNAAAVGAGQYVLNIGSKLAASVVTNNTVKIADGALIMQGRHVRLAESVDLAIDNGATGTKRKDLIVARYTKNSSSGVEEVNLVVIKGTAAATPSDPEYITGDILTGGAVQNDMPLYRVELDGINVQTPVKLFSEIDAYTAHTASRSNPHGVTAAQTGAKVAGAVEPVSAGGTGATNPTEARANLGINPANIGASSVGHTHVVSQITNFPSAMPANDVYPWAKAAGKPSYNFSEVGAAAANHGHDINALGGTLAASKGGTGVTSIADLKVALNVAVYVYDANTQTLYITLGV